ncbi:MAG: hypothetical protein IT208_05240 [Chthonomonadales bacterium]|nr:hypothetical protein [Chthonomonadales bacterium]
MDWGIAVLAVEILLLVAGWLLYQQARAELNARAAEAPVLSEVRALQASVSALLEQLKLESVQTSAQLEARSLEARELIATLERRIEETRKGATRPAARRRDSSARAAALAAESEAVPASDPRYREVSALADNGLDAVAIARQTGISEGEVELILGLRARQSP